MGDRLLVHQALWAMDGLTAPEASMSEKFDRVLQAGFDGMAIDLGALSMAQAETSVAQFARTGLAGALTAFPTSIEGLRPALLLAQRIAAPFVVVIGQVMPVRLEEMVPLIEGWLRVAEQECMPIQFETHRNCITNDLYTPRCSCSRPCLKCACPRICRTMWWIAKCLVRRRRPSRR